MVLMVLFTEILFALSLGLGISYVLKGNAGAVIMVIIQLVVLWRRIYAGCKHNGIHEGGATYSPLHWSNEALRSSIQAVGRRPCMR